MLSSNYTISYARIKNWFLSFCTYYWFSYDMSATSRFSLFSPNYFFWSVLDLMYGSLKMNAKKSFEYECPLRELRRCLRSQRLQFNANFFSKFPCIELIKKINKKLISPRFGTDESTILLTTVWNANIYKASFSYKFCLVGVEGRYFETSSKLRVEIRAIDNTGCALSNEWWPIF